MVTFLKVDTEAMLHDSFATGSDKHIFAFSEFKTF